MLALEGAAAPERSRIDAALGGLREDGCRCLFKIEAGDAASRVIVVANGSVEKDRDASAAALRAVQDLLAGRRAERPSAGIGEACVKPSHIGRSCLQAMACLDYTLVKGRGEIVFFGELPRQPGEDASCLDGPIKDLALSIREGDGAGVESVMASIVETMKARRYPPFLARCACFDLINAVIHTARDCGLSLADSPEDMPFRRLEQFRTIDDLAGIVRDLGVEVQRVLAGAHRLSPLSVQARCRIREHFTEPDFYIQQLCASLNASPSCLSQVFKQSYGTTISDYLSRLRIEEAQRLPQSTDLGVDQIIRRVGYTDRSSFSRKFRTWVGTTPGGYRKRVQRDGVART